MNIDMLKAMTQFFLPIDIVDFQFKVLTYIHFL
jgi:hypothetical protein